MTANRSLHLTLPTIRYGAGCQVFRSGHNDRKGLLVLDKAVCRTHREKWAERNCCILKLPYGFEETPDAKSLIFPATIFSQQTMKKQSPMHYHKLKISSLRITRIAHYPRVSLRSGSSGGSSGGSSSSSTAQHILVSSLSLSLSARATSAATAYSLRNHKERTTSLWRRSQSTVLIHLDHILHLLLVMSLAMMEGKKVHLLVLDGHLHVKGLAILKSVILLLLVGELIGLVQVLLVLLQSNLEIQSLRSLLETNTDVGLLAVLLDSHDEITGRIQHGFNDLCFIHSPLPYRRTILADGRGGEQFSIIVHQFDVTSLSAENHVQCTKPDLVRPAGSTVTHTGVSWGNLIHVTSANVAEVLFKNIVTLHYLRIGLAPSSSPIHPQFIGYNGTYL